MHSLCTLLRHFTACQGLHYSLRCTVTQTFSVVQGECFNRKLHYNGCQRVQSSKLGHSVYYLIGQFSFSWPTLQSTVCFTKSIQFQSFNRKQEQEDGTWWFRLLIKRYHLKILSLFYIGKILLIGSI